ncbi:hypothetical protein BTEBP_50004 [Brochothrix thermosphacta]|nr:hypothetical protein BTEBP_50004 [Brochothrix thermosphacta]
MLHDGSFNYIIRRCKSIRDEGEDFLTVLLPQLRGEIIYVHTRTTRMAHVFRRYTH